MRYWSNYPSGLVRLALAGLIFGLAAAPVANAQQAHAATFGDVIQLAAGTPSDVVLDESRHLLYLVNNTTNQVNILDYTSNRIVGSIAVGSTPLAGAMSMDGKWLYVTSAGTSAMVQIDLSSQRVNQTVLLPSAPQGVEVGSDGRVLISMNGTGVVSGVPQGTLAIFDPSQTGSAQLQTVAVPELPAMPAPIPAPTLPRPITTFASKLLRTPDGSYIVGVITPTFHNLPFRLRSFLGHRIARPHRFGRILGALHGAGRIEVHVRDEPVRHLHAGGDRRRKQRQRAVCFHQRLEHAAERGRQHFRPGRLGDLCRLQYRAGDHPAGRDASFHLAGERSRQPGNPAGDQPAGERRRQDRNDQGRFAGLGSVRFRPAAPASGQPVHLPDTGADDQHRVPVDGRLPPRSAQATLKVNNAGQGKLTYTVAATNNAALIYQQSSGLAPSTITFTMEPGRTGITRQAGTNIWSGGTGVASVSGTPFTVRWLRPMPSICPRSSACT